MPVANLDDLHESRLIVDRIDYAVISLADAVPFLPGELFVAVRAGIETNRAKAGDAYCKS